MAPIKNLRFDCYLNRFKAQNEMQFVSLFSRQLASVCETEQETLSHLISSRIDQGELSFSDGGCVIDLQSLAIKKPALVLTTMEDPLKIGDHKPVDVIAAVLSCRKCGAGHLQKLSKISRLLRSEEFCDEVRACHDTDSMELMFMPGHKLVDAA